MYQFKKFILPLGQLIVALLFTWPLNTLALPNTQVYQLDNGLKLIVREDHRAPVVFSSLWYKVGGSYEKSGLTGISHALEHMMFRGTKTHSSGELQKMINSKGGDQNAETAEDFTVYFQLLPADKLATTFSLEADRMQNLSLNENDFKKEIQVVMEERRMRTDDDPQMLTWEQLNAVAHINNPQHHPVVGWMSDLQQMTAQDLRQWYQKWYAPNNALLVVVGDVKPEQVLKLANQHFAPLKAIQLPLVKKTQEVTTFGARHLQVDVPAKMPWLVMAYNTPSLATASQKWEPYALLVLADILGGGNSARLKKSLLRDQRLVTQIDTDYSPLALHDNLFTFYTTPAANHSNAEVQHAILAQIKVLTEQPISTAELQKEKARAIATHVYSKDELMNQAFDLAIPEMIGLSWHEADNFVSNIEAVTAQQVQAVAKKYLTNNRLTVATLMPKQKQPDQKEAAQHGK